MSSNDQKALAEAGLLGVPRSKNCVEVLTSEDEAVSPTTAAASSRTDDRGPRPRSSVSELVAAVTAGGWFAELSLGDDVGAAVLWVVVVGVGRISFVFRGQDLDAVLASRDPQQPGFRERFLIVGRHRDNEPTEASGREIQDVKRRGQGKE